MSQSETQELKELVVTRDFDAPLERVWKAWTDPEEIKKWWGPKNFTAPSIENDVRVGGTYLYCMLSPDGKEYWSTGTYREVVPMKRIVVTDSFADAEGNVVPASHYGMPDGVALENQVTVTFEETDGKTTLTIRHTGFTPEMAEMAGAGWNESLDKLAESL